MVAEFTQHPPALLRRDGALPERLATTLSQGSLAHWRNVLAQLLASYDGFAELVASDEDTPGAQVARLLATYRAPPSDEQFAADLSKLDFFRWRVGRASEPERWNPLEESLHDFGVRGLVVWSWDNPLIEPCEVAAWLLANLLRDRLTGIAT